jgi:hypothetical protein
MNRDSEELFSRFLKASTHLIRGDLSVISSELSFLAGLVGEEQVALGRKRCAAVAHTLSMISSGCSTGVQEAISLEELADAFGIACDIQGILVVCERGRLLHCIGELEQLLGAWSGDISFDGAVKINLSLATQQQADADADGEFNSISAYVAQSAGDGAVLRSVLVDLFLRSQGWAVRLLCSQGGLRLSLIVPCEKGAMYG